MTGPALRHVRSCACAECDAVRYAADMELERNRWRNRVGGLENTVRCLTRMLSEAHAESQRLRRITDRLIAEREALLDVTDVRPVVGASAVMAAYTGGK